MTDKLKLIIKDLKKYEPEKIILFGSGARGEMDEYSDIDLVVIKETKKSFVERLVEVVDFLSKDAPHADIFVYTPTEFEVMKEEENPFMEQVLKDGKVVYEKS
jgi:predicted nucleotidyltransferase